MVTFYTVVFYTFIYYTVQSLYRSKFIQVKIYTAQNLYGAKFIQFKISTVIFYPGQNLYSSKFILQNLYWRKKPLSAPNFMAQSFEHFILFIGCFVTQTAAIRPPFFTCSPNFWPCGLSAVKSLRKSAPLQKTKM
jgi:hypothetical protein